MTQRKFRFGVIQEIVRQKHGGQLVAEKLLSNGDVFCRESSGARSGCIVKASALTKHYETVMNVTKHKQFRDDLDDLAKEGLEASIKKKNPFHNKQHGQATFGNPWAESDRESNGLPSDASTNSGLPSTSAKAVNERVAARRNGSSLPSNKRG